MSSTERLVVSVNLEHVKLSEQEARSTGIGTQSARLAFHRVSILTPLSFRWAATMLRCTIRLQRAFRPLSSGRLQRTSPSNSTRRRSQPCRKITRKIKPPPVQAGSTTSSTPTTQCTPPSTSARARPPSSRRRLSRRNLRTGLGTRFPTWETW